MFGVCRNYLITKLKEAGVRTQPFTSMKKLRTTQESHVGAVLFDEETFERNGSKTIYIDKEGDRKKRRKVFVRSLHFDVIIGEYTEDKLSEIFDKFLSSLDRGLMIDGNYVEIEPEKADWVDDDDSILKAKIAVQLKIKFIGGTYKDSGFARVKEVEILSIDLDRKENEDGN